jgi:6-pyruvoyltetrahydropterin/6-carboxytetrahydropterin synthase
MYRVRKQFSFSAAHRLTNLAPDHPCMRQHGHNYLVEVVLCSVDLDPITRFVVDYRELDKFKQWLDDTCDHKDLNEVFTNMQTTAENLAHAFFTVCKQQWQQTLMVRVSETPKTWAEYF